MQDIFQYYVKSQGADDGWTCDIQVNGVQKATQTRGFCVVTYDPDAQLFQSETYDTHDFPESEVGFTVATDLRFYENQP